MIYIERILRRQINWTSNWRLLLCGRICREQHLHKEIRLNFPLEGVLFPKKTLPTAKKTLASVFFCEWFEDMISRWQLEYHLEEVLHVRSSSCDLLSTLWAKLLVEAKPGERLKIKAVGVFLENTHLQASQMWCPLIQLNIFVGGFISSKQTCS